MRLRASARIALVIAPEPATRHLGERTTNLLTRNGAGRDEDLGA
jgi:hypothetical protein